MHPLSMLARRAAMLCTTAATVALATSYGCSGGSDSNGSEPPGAGGSAGASEGGAAGSGAGNGAGAGAGSAGTPGDPPLPFEAVSPYAYTAKIKNLLTGLPPTDAELSAVVADPGALRGLVDAWAAGPEFRAKMRSFFANAFQQTQLNGSSLTDQLDGRPLRGEAAEPLLRNVAESFARTAVAFVGEGRPLTEAVTTRQFMLTPALKSLLAYLDADHVSDEGNRNQGDRVPFTLILDGTTVIPLEQSIDPAGPNFMKWAPGGKAAAECPTRTSDQPYNLFSALLGFTPTAAGCGGEPFAATFGAADFDDWRLVTLRPRGEGEASTPFYDLPALRGATELALRVPRVGFFSTPAFFANWATNDSNQSRVTTNQSLIVALGASFDGADATVPLGQGGLDGEHAAPGTECYGCHQALDPMRQYFSQAYTYYGHDQRDPQKAALPGNFAFGGATAQGKGPADLAEALASHPRFAAAWAHKLCHYADSARCSDGDPEFQRVVEAFRASGHDFKVLVREMFSSPLVTGAEHVATFDDRGVVVSIARANHLCDALSRRLGLEGDFCGLQVSLARPPAGSAPVFAGAIPSDSYSRGSEIPVTLSDATLFFQGAVEGLCTAVANATIGGAAGVRYPIGKPQEAIDDFVRTVMALAAPDPRAAPAGAILREHYEGAVAGGAKPADALKSTFILACTSPTSIATGL
ncbi:MAG: DUF1585 domain-containing protein [Polyangiaceae bacterium]|nr:DUF1585 domain-containing protein [Polyangiaceae bacterium]